MLLSPCNLNNYYYKETVRHIITLLRYAVAKNDASKIRNRIRYKKNRDEEAYIQAGNACKQVTREWKPRVLQARLSLGTSFRLISDQTAGYKWFKTHIGFIERKDFQKFIDIYETEKAIETLLTGEDNVANTITS